MSRSRLTALLMLLPSFALVAGIIGYPIADLVEMSTHAVNRFGRIGSFVAAANFAELAPGSDLLGELPANDRLDLCVTGAQRARFAPGRARAGPGFQRAAGWPA